MLNKFLLIILIIAHCFTIGKKFILHEYLSFIYLNNCLIFKKGNFQKNTTISDEIPVYGIHWLYGNYCLFIIAFY
jgi:hypothetical protein